ncbi:MAG: SRPBCC domain-containing protein [Crocinitomicaceae bacterium]|nr:SRPBCC domain-containing protein [Crocinitomicaceae bacterium]
MSNGEFLEVSATIHAPLDQVWEKWTQAEHVVNWNFAHESWCCPTAEVDFSVGGSSVYRMEARDGSFGFDLKATFLAIEVLSFIASELEDGRKVEVKFIAGENAVLLQQRFQPETENTLALQQQGWQAILNQFKSYCE